MTDPENAGQEKREAEAAQAEKKQGHGAVPNVTPEQAVGEAGELKEAVHQLEEEKGDWSKDH
jgi:hypothetical protein